MSPTPFFILQTLLEDKRDVYEILEGNFKHDHHPSSREIRLYISSEFTGTTSQSEMLARSVGCQKFIILVFSLKFCGALHLTDSSHEKSCIIKDVLPDLRLRCKSLGIQFYAVELCSAISSDCIPPPTHPLSSSEGSQPRSIDRQDSKDSEVAQEDGVIHHLERCGIFKLAREEIKRCQELSAGPNFIVSTHDTMKHSHHYFLRCCGRPCWLRGMATNLCALTYFRRTLT